MRYFTLLDFQHMILAFFLGLIAVICIIVAWWRYPPQESEAEQESIQSGRTRVPHPVPPILIFVIVGSLLAAVGYVLIVGILGGPIT